MNKKQKAALWVGIILISLMGIFPPWKLSYPETQSLFFDQAVGYAFIFAPFTLWLPTEVFYGKGGLLKIEYIWLGRSEKYLHIPRGYHGIELDFFRLLVQWIVVVIIVGGYVLTHKGQ